MNKSYNLDVELCTCIGDLDEFFKREGICSAEQQLDYLTDYMCIAGEIGCCELVSIEDKCNVAKETFISGEWRQMTNKYT